MTQRPGKGGVLVAKAQSPDDTYSMYEVRSM